MARCSSEEPVYETLLESFADDPFMRWMFPTDAGFRTGFPRLARAWVPIATQTGTLDSLGSGEGLGVWLPPGREPSLAAFLPIAWRGVPGRRWSTLLRVYADVQRRKPTEPHWYLALIGVPPRHRGVGRGSQLLEHGLARCDEEGRVAYLEATSPRNVGLYERHGFQCLEPIQRGAAPPLFPMARAPRSIPAPRIGTRRT